MYFFHLSPAQFCLSAVTRHHVSGVNWCEVLIDHAKQCESQRWEVTKYKYFVAVLKWTFFFLGIFTSVFLFLIMFYFYLLHYTQISLQSTPYIWETFAAIAF